MRKRARKPFRSTRAPGDRDREADALVAELQALTGIRSWSWADGDTQHVVVIPVLQARVLANRIRRRGRLG